MKDPIRNLLLMILLVALHSMPATNPNYFVTYPIAIFGTTDRDSKSSGNTDDVQISQPESTSFKTTLPRTENHPQKLIFRVNLKKQRNCILYPKVVQSCYPVIL